MCIIFGEGVFAKANDAVIASKRKKEMLNFLDFSVGMYSEHGAKLLVVAVMTQNNFWSTFLKTQGVK